MPFAQHPSLRLVIAIGIGLLIGAERERRRATGAFRSAAGVRTYTLTALSGGLSFLIGGQLLVAIAAACVGVFGAISYPRTSRRDPGLTSEMALFATVLLGALAMQQPVLAAALGVTVTVLLAARSRMHRFVRDLLTEQEAHDVLLFAAASLVILPLMPNHAIGPYNVLNPRRFWELVVLVMAISGAGYIALRSLGPRVGLALAGIVGGFVSAVATIGSMARRAAQDPSLARACTAGAVLSSIATVAQMAVVLLAVSPATSRAVAFPLLFAGVAAVGYGAFFLAGKRPADEHAAAEPGRAFSLKAAFSFAALLLFVMFISAAITQRLGTRGLLLVAGLAGFADAHSAAISVASLANSGRIAVSDAVLPILMGLTTNTVTKAAFAGIFGGRRFFLKVVPGLLLMVLAAWAGWFFA